VAAIIEAYEDGLPVVLLTHRLAIKGQWKKDELLSTNESDIAGYFVKEESRIFKLGENVRELSCEDHYSVHDLPKAIQGRVLIALDKSLSDRPELMPEQFTPGLLVADEVHQYNDPTGRLILDGFFERRLGLSATFSGFDDYGLLPYFGGIKVADYPIHKALRDEVICEYNLLAIRVPYNPVQGFGVTYQKVDLNSKPLKEYTQEDLDKADLTVNAVLSEILEPSLGFPFNDEEDFDAILDRVILSRHPSFMPLAKKYIRARSDYDKITRKFKSQSSVLELIAPKIRSFGRTLVFANTKIQGKELHDDLSDLQVPVTYIDSDTEQFGRKDAFRALQENLTKAIISPQILDEGVNIPNAQIGLFLGKGNGKYRQTVQRMGRVLRKKENNGKALLILAVGMYTREDPGALGESVYPDSQFAVMSKNCSRYEISDFDKPEEIANYLAELLP
jgi:superfamily II DNA or RNA helicase